MAVALDPKDGKAHNPRGRVLGRPDMTVKAIAGLRRAADLQRAPARTLLASRTEPQGAMETPRSQVMKRRLAMRDLRELPR